MGFKFEKLDVWQKAVGLYAEVCHTANRIPRMEQSSLGDQTRRATLSVSTNIAEGTGRDGLKEARYFYNVAKGSVYEVVSLLYVMRERHYVQDAEYEHLYARCDEIARMLSGLLAR